MDVSIDVKKAYKDDTVHKTLKIVIPSLDIEITNNKIWSESLSLKENLMQGNNFDFVGCISSQFSIIVNGISDKVQGKFIEVYIKTDNTDYLPLFSGYVNSVEKQTNRTFKKIIAYDELSKKGKKNILEWYKNVSFPITIKQLRDDFFDFIGITQEITTLKNDNLVLTNKYIPTALSALDLAKSICQLNGVCGIINRNNKFEYRTISSSGDSTEEGSFPGILVPNSKNAYPGFYRSIGKMSDSDNQNETIGYYRKVDYKDYTVIPIDKVVIRKSANEIGQSYGKGENEYIIQANILANGIDDETLISIAKNIYDNVKNISFIPFTSNNNGLPYMEVGKDTVNMYVLDDKGKEFELKTFCILNRELKGIQSLIDNYSADAEETQKEFPTDTRTEVESAVQYVSGNISQQVQEEFGIMVQSVSQLPQNPKRNVIYLIQGEVVVN